MFRFKILLLCLVFFASWGECQSNKVFNVGLVIPLTGSAADYGIAIKNGIELAKKDSPELFSNIKFHYEDAAYDPKTAITAFNKLIFSKKINLIVTWGVSFCKALAPIAEAKKNTFDRDMP